MKTSQWGFPLHAYYWYMYNNFFIYIWLILKNKLKDIFEKSKSSVTVTTAKKTECDQKLADLEAAATTLLSSIAIGMAYIFWLIRKFGATPKGM